MGQYQCSRLGVSQPKSAYTSLAETRLVEKLHDQFCAFFARYGHLVYVVTECILAEISSYNAEALSYI